MMTGKKRWQVPGRGILAGLVMSLLGMSGCGDSARDLYSTAELEELQNNPSHAMQLYEEIVARHPNSEYGSKAKARLVELKSVSGK